MKIKDKKLSSIMKLPALLFFVSALLGIIIGFFILKQSGFTNMKFEIDKPKTFFSILCTNSSIVLSVYISVVFTKYYAYFVYILNGITLGVYLGWILQQNITLILLVLPHGIFEIPCLLATGIIVYLGETYVRNNFKNCCKILAVHLCFVVGCAIIETYVTPLIYNSFLSM